MSFYISRCKWFTYPNPDPKRRGCFSLDRTLICPRNSRLLLVTRLGRNALRKHHFLMQCTKCATTTTTTMTTTTPSSTDSEHGGGEELGWTESARDGLHQWSIPKVTQSSAHGQRLQRMPRLLYHQLARIELVVDKASRQPSSVAS